MKHFFLQFAIGTLMDDYLGWYIIYCKNGTYNNIIIYNNFYLIISGLIH
jgi:hypothetical protein